jgi:uncharacterized protein (TIGR02186 family)
MQRLALAFMLALWCLPAKAADQLAVGLTEEAIHITSSFSGAEFVVYGTVETSDLYAPANGRDILIVVRGPNRPETVRKKDQVAGIWLNADEVRFEDAPSFYYLVSSVPLDRLTAPAILKRKQLGLDNIALGGPKRRDINDFRKALVRNRVNDQLYVEDIGAVEMNGPALFHARIRMPASVAVGTYSVEAYLFRDGREISSHKAQLVVDKQGLERSLFEIAHQFGALYGIATLMLAGLIGFGAALIFRERD